MRDALTVSICAILAALGLIHLYWAGGGRLGKGAAIPSVGGVATFSPSKARTFAVAVALFLAAALVAIAGGIVAVPIPDTIVLVATVALGLVFFARAVGDFRLVGFFKKASASRFARLDTMVYSPLCLVLAVAIAVIIWMR